MERRRFIIKKLYVYSLLVANIILAIFTIKEFNKYHQVQDINNYLNNNKQEYISMLKEIDDYEKIKDNVILMNTNDDKYNKLSSEIDNKKKKATELDNGISNLNIKLAELSK